MKQKKIGNFFNVMAGGRKTPSQEAKQQIHTSEILNLLKQCRKYKGELNHIENEPTDISKDEFLFYFDNYPGFRRQVSLWADTFKETNPKAVSDFLERKRQNNLFPNDSSIPDLFEIKKLMDDNPIIAEALSKMCKIKDFSNNFAFLYENVIKTKLS